MKPFIAPIHLFKTLYPNPKKKNPFTTEWLEVLKNEDMHPAVVDFIERLACENHSMAEGIRQLHSAPIQQDGYNLFIGSQAFSETVFKEFRSHTEAFDERYREAIVSVLTEAGVEKPIDIAMQIAFRAGVSEYDYLL